MKPVVREKKKKKGKRKRKRREEGDGLVKNKNTDTNFLKRFVKEVWKMGNQRVNQREWLEDILSKISTKEIRALPEITMSPLKQREKGDEEEVVLLLSDWQLGCKTISFNSDIAKKRINAILKGVLKIVNLHRKAYPVKKINLFILGDMIQNEKVGYLIDLSELERILIEQVFDIAVPMLLTIITTLTKYFEEVKVYCVRGNHGRGEIGSSEKTNWDDVIYKVVSLSLRENRRVKFKIAREFYQIVDVLDNKFLLIHGDQVRGGSYNIPLYALLQRMLRWETSMPEKWDVICCGHWHHFAEVEQNKKRLICNGTLVSDDEYSRKNWGWSPSTGQKLFGVHPRKGVTWSYHIEVGNIR